MAGTSPLLSGLAWVDEVHGLDSTGFLQDLSYRSSKLSPSHALSGYGFRRFDEGASALALRDAGGPSPGGPPGPLSLVVVPAPGDGVRPTVGVALAARGGRCAGALSEELRPSRAETGAPLYAGGCQQGASGGPVRGCAGGPGRPTGRVLWPAREGDAAARRRDPGLRRQADHQLGGRRLRQAARGLRPGRCAGIAAARPCLMGTGRPQPSSAH